MPQDDDKLETLMKMDKEGLSSTNKTAQWIANWRQTESQRDDALFLEGLVMHLETAAVRGLQEAIAGFSAAGSLAIVSVVGGSKEHHTGANAGAVLGAT